MLPPDGLSWLDWVTATNESCLRPPSFLGEVRDLHEVLFSTPCWLIEETIDTSGCLVERIHDPNWWIGLGRPDRLLVYGELSPNVKSPDSPGANSGNHSIGPITIVGATDKSTSTMALLNYGHRAMEGRRPPISAHFYTRCSSYWHDGVPMVYDSQSME